ncbi:NifU family protein [Mycobacterium camsae]|uniref:NifU family protein n=1 Tax=Mycobacterium gordonae TaxID=1778 RepID=UPI00197DB8B5|nr:NifU family protein [Mycobacterium gordonae]
MSVPLLHPQATDDPRLVRWLTGTRQLSDVPPQLGALIDQGVLERAEVGPGEVRTWLGVNRSWQVDGPRVRSALFDALSAQGADVSQQELRDEIEEILARDVSPIAAAHGGAIKVHSVRDGVLTVELTGACLGCPLSGRTLGDLVTRSVQDRFPQIREVKATKPRRTWLSLSRKSSGQ